MSTAPNPGKWYAEISEGTSAATNKISGRLKWGDIVLKRGVAEMPPSALLTLRSGQGFCIEVPQRETTPSAIAELKAASAGHIPLDVAVGDNRTGGALGRASKIEAITIKQKVSSGPGGPVIEIQLRKL
jgi:hypothetical protein